MDSIKSPSLDLLSGKPAESISPTLNPQAPSKEKELKKAEGAAEQFESLLLGQMFSSMWQGVGKNDLFGDGREMEYYRDFYNKALSDSVASGQGIGIKDVILKEMKEKISKEG